MQQEINSKPNIVILVGPTAVGKTDVSIAVAKALNGEIISADSAQVYKYMDIGTAKISYSEMQGIKHHMIDEVTPDQSFSVAQFRDKADQYIHQITHKGKLPIVTGGTGLYINSLLNNLDFTKSVGDEDFRQRMQELADNKGNEYLHEMLKTIDEESYQRLHANDVRRVIRALEVYEYTGKTISHFQEESKKIPPRYHAAYVGLTMDRQKLYERINQRVDTMLEKGLIEEVKKLLNMGYSRDLVSMQALGYKEIVQYLKGEISLEEAVFILKRDSRHYAKRQLTWFRRDERIKWFDVDEYQERTILVKNIINYIAGKIYLL
ncbi:MAG: tRNA delta(2)-isopentenylpyrophosphate transferase [Anaerocolumna sp.]|jgi:tRNA dimethylallyltransferase|nr:tRNA delta(2)-isopentenylpyrophosphate transferase [Anaerocolumna sp.]